jgi:polysaccharide export outer membrane protein
MNAVSPSRVSRAAAFPRTAVDRGSIVFRLRTLIARCAAAAVLSVAGPGCHLWSPSEGGGQDVIPVSRRVTDVAAPGIATVRGQDGEAGSPSIAPPKELDMTTLQRYVIEPPDILLIEAVKLIPKPPYKIEPLDILQVFVEGTLLDQPIAGMYAVDPGGMVALGPAYGSVKVAGMSIEETAIAIEKHLRRAQLKEPQVSLSLAQTAGQQQIVGEHMVGPDGTVNLGTYGVVDITGLTIDEARAALENHLSARLESPKLSVDIFAYNSKVYHVIMESVGQGDRVFELPVTGKETVLNAVAKIGGISQMSSRNMWIARPTPSSSACVQILPVDWKEITRSGSTKTNYQILPGDRLFIAEDRLVAMDTMVTRMTAPFERMFGFTLLGVQALQTTNRFPKGLSSTF